MKGSTILKLGSGLAAVAAGAAITPQQTWAVIAAGSSTYGNYRHQADACHAYQILKKSGVPPEQIILMMADDVANSPSNPFPGKLFNRAGDDVPDVYAGCQVDYRGEVVTPDLFKKVITGDDSALPAGSKVLKSGPNDRVFLNFVDHGGVGIIAFPYGGLLHATELGEAISTMKEKNMYGEVVFYMEACESGSMFPNLPTDTKFLAVTAANGQESSWGYYCMPNDRVNGKDMGTCLGDLFSISWMEDSDEGALATESIKEQVQRVTTRTTKSHVMTFGDHSFEDEPIGDFERTLGLRGRARAVAAPASNEGAVSVREIALQQAFEQWRRAQGTAGEKAAYQRLRAVMAMRDADDGLFKRLAERACTTSEGPLLGCMDRLEEQRLVMKDHSCHLQLVRAVHGACPKREAHHTGGWNGYNMKYSQLLVNICEMRHELGHTEGALQGFVREECNHESQQWQAEHAGGEAAIAV